MSQRTGRILVALVVVSACLVFMTPQIGSSTEYGHVTEMTLHPSPFNYHGACPVTINFYGLIKVDGPNTITYGITRSDGGSGEGKQTLHFAGAGQKSVHFTWRLGQGHENYNGWAQIGSGNTRSNKAEFHIHCM
jgi:hypothetical protein